jgi:hypothetical protein
MTDEHLSENVEYRHAIESTNYLVGDDGSTWSSFDFKKRVFGGPWWRTKQTLDGGGRLMVRLVINGKSCGRLVSKLVLEAFRGPRPPGMEGCHNDGNSLNNNLSNLRWDTHLANVRDMFRHGTSNTGSRHGMSKLDEEKVAQIIELAKQGIRTRVIACKFGVSDSCISTIRHGKSWRHITR